MTATPLTAERVAADLRRFRYSFVTEAVLQRGVAQALGTSGYTFEEQVTLTPGDRIDFMVAETIGIELKVDGSRNDVWRQLERYLASPKLTDLILVTSRRRHQLTLPASLCGKPIVYVHSGGSF